MMLDFHTNKKILEQVAIIPSKRLCNKIVSFSTHLMKVQSTTSPSNFRKRSESDESAIPGCMAALDAEHYLQEIGEQEGKYD
ncbi:40S ribosomal protein S17-2 [Nymphaea thermarum]|nr:40S ribosomal protein S17-2 [Nymphaea thermarum]